MFERDYLMNLLMQFFKSIVRANELKRDKDDPQGAADILEAAVEDALEMRGVGILYLEPDSMVQVMQVSGIDQNVTQFVARSLLLESVYLHEADNSAKAQLRESQARSIAAVYGFELPEDAADFESITDGLEEAALAGGFGNADDPLAYLNSLLA